jgi:hypothetical protein
LNSLTVALASLGGIVLAGVVAHGAWQARRAGPKRAAPTVREEPSASVASERDGGALADDAGGDAAVAAALPRASKRMPIELDALIDAFAPIALEVPIAGDAVLAHLPSKRHVGSKLVLVEGLEVESGRWEAPISGRRYGELQAGVQLASRTGPLNEIEYSEFVQRMQAFAEAIGASLDPPDMLDVMARARELDAFASEDDAQLAPDVEPFRAWQAAAQALAVGMDADVSDDDGRPLTSAGFEAIGAELGKLYAALEARDLAAGTPAARRLFS